MPVIDGITRRQVQQRALAALMDAETLAQDRIYEPRDWPTDPAMFPVLLVSTPTDRKVGIYPGQFEFTTTISIAVIGRVIGAAPDEVNDTLDLLSLQVEDALMLSPVFAQDIQQFSSITTSSVVNAQGKNHIGEIGIVFDLVVFQVFGQTKSEPLRNVKSKITDAVTGETLTRANAPVDQEPLFRSPRDVR